MQIEITFTGGLGVKASLGPHTIQTDQPARDGGNGSAPSPFDLFLSSIGTCAGFYILSFLKERNLSSEGIRVTQTATVDPETKMIAQVTLDIVLPSDFPEKYRPALIRAAKLCTVKKHIEHPPKFVIAARTDERQNGGRAW